MEDNKMIKLILKSKIYTISSNSPFLSSISPLIYTKLISEKSYEVKSNVSDNVFQHFIYYLTDRKPPEISSDNIIEYDILSQEFDLMKDLIQLYKNKMQNIDKNKSKQNDLLQTLQNKTKEIDQKTINYHQIIRLLFKNKKTISYRRFLQIRKELFEACKSESVTLVSLYTQKMINYENEFIIFLNKEKKTAGIIKSISRSFTIPNSIKYKSQKYLITGIYENAFMQNPLNSDIDFSNNYDIEFIEKKSFSHSNITSITLPSKLTKIEEQTFSFCENLNKVVFTENSKLKTIEKFAFMNSPIKTLIIPSCVSEFNEGWCKGTNIINILIMPSNEKNIFYYDNKFIIGKSDPKSDVFDILLYARRNIKEALIPSFIKIIDSYAFENCTCLKKVEFTNDSQLKSIKVSAFENTSLISLSIPSSVIELQSNWCANNRFLTDIKILQSKEKNILYYDNKFIIGKSDPKSDIFDVLILAPRDIKEALIPSFIKIIAPNAFSNCLQLTKVEFDSNSNLEIIGKNAFSNTSICQISIPPSCNKIEEYSFSYCYKLNNFEILNVHESLMICEYCFFCSLLKCLSITLSGIKFQNNCFYGLLFLNEIKIIPNKKQDILYYDDKYIVGKSNPKSENFDVLIFSQNNINNKEQTITIPPFIKKIESFAFCSNVFKTLQFSENSQIRSTDKQAFMRSNFETIIIPPFVTKIGPFSLSNNNMLKNVIFEDNSQLKIIEKSSFAESTLTSITIPSSVTEICENAFFKCFNLVTVEFAKNSQLKSIKKNAFYKTSIKKIIIPSHVTIIGEFAFSDCQFLTNVEFEKNSGLITINSSAFSYSAIKQILIPSNVVYIESDAFYKCKSLTIVEFDNNSSLRLIGRLAFSETSINKIKIPSHVVLIDDFAFDCCSLLKKVDFSENSELQFIGFNAFISTAITIFKVPKHVKTIGGSAISNCENLIIFECEENSELKSIGTFLISDSPLKTMILPSSVSQFDYEWCALSYNLNKIDVSIGSTQNIMNYKNNYILLKSDSKSDIFDVLVFARRNIEYAFIPSFIKKIASYAFNNCKRLEIVEFSRNSQLVSIEYSAFNNSSVSYINFPASLEYICEDSFSECKYLKEIDFSSSINLKVIEQNAFYNCFANKIVIPSSVEVQDGAFCNSNFIDIEIIPFQQKNICLFNNRFLLKKSNKNNNIFDVLFFFKQDSPKVIIPSFIKKIGQYTLNEYINLNELDFEKNSECTLIDDNAFIFLNSLKRAFIPRKVTKIGSYCFSNCKSLKKIDFEENSSLQIIEAMAFQRTALECFSIPEKVIKIGNYAFSDCINLQIVEINDESKLKIIDSKVFDRSPNILLMVSSNLKEKLFII